MKTILIQLMLFAPVVLEAWVIDPLFWKKGKSDKPVSTYIRAGMFVVVAVVVRWVLDDNWMSAGLLMAIAWHFATFQYFVNWKLGKPFFYLGSGTYDRCISHVPSYLRLFLQMVGLLAALLAYHYMNSTIYQDTTILFNLPKYR